MKLFEDIPVPNFDINCAFLLPHYVNRSNAALEVAMLAYENQDWKNALGHFKRISEVSLLIIEQIPFHEPNEDLDRLKANALTLYHQSLDKIREIEQHLNPPSLWSWFKNL